MPGRLSTIAIAAVLLASLANPALSGADPAPASPTPAAAHTLRFPDNPREAGARYGQAAGVALVCYGLVTKPAAEELKAHYTGDGLTAFNDQAALILNSWKDLLSCKHATGPNECKISQGKSCFEANREIGLMGSKLPGLVAPKPEKADAAVVVVPRAGQ